MKVIKLKNKKKLTKELRRLVKEHGSEMALGLSTGILANIIVKNAAKSKEAETVVVLEPEIPETTTKVYSKKTTVKTTVPKPTKTKDAKKNIIAPINTEKTPVRRTSTKEKVLSID